MNKDRVWISMAPDGSNRTYVHLIDALEAAETLDALDDAALRHYGYWTAEERACYERRVREFKAAERAQG